MRRRNVRNGASCKMILKAIPQMSMELEIKLIRLLSTFCCVCLSKLSDTSLDDSLVYA